jgi:hypothetical protein
MMGFKNKEVTVDKKIVFLMMMAALPAVFMTGCNGNPSGPSNPVATPAPYSTPQTIPQASVNLLSSGNFVLLAYTAITNSGYTPICGSIGLAPGSSVGLTGMVISCGGVTDVDDTAANTAKTDLSTAYTSAQGRTGGASIPAGANIGGQTLYPGLYIDGGDLTITSSDLTLNANGDSSAVFIFRVAGILNVTSGRKVILAGGATAANVYWAVTNFCSLGTTASMVGNILAYNSITFNTGASLTGRALGENGNITLLSSKVTHP